MLTQVLNDQTIATLGTAAGTLACKSLNGVFLKTAATAYVPEINITVTANGNTVANAIPVDMSSFLTSVQGIPSNSVKVNYLDFGSLKVNGAVEIQIYNGTAASASNIDVMANVDLPGSYSCTYAKYSSDTLSAKSVSLVTFGSVDNSDSIVNDTDMCTIRSGSRTQSISYANAWAYGQTNANAVNAESLTYIGLFYKGAPADLNLTGTSLGADQYYCTKSIWKN